MGIVTVKKHRVAAAYDDSSASPFAEKVPERDFDLYLEAEGDRVNLRVARTKNDYDEDWYLMEFYVNEDGRLTFQRFDGIDDEAIDTDGDDRIAEQEA